MELAQLFVDGFMVLTGCAGFASAVYGISLWMREDTGFLDAWFGEESRDYEWPSFRRIFSAVSRKCSSLRYL